jgi:hypothetical protein
MVLFREGVCRYEPKRRGRQTEPWKSDHRIVPMKPGNAGGGKAVTPPWRVEGAPAVHRDGDPVNSGWHASRGRLSDADWVKMGVGSRMREMRTSGSERGRGTIVAWLGRRVLGCGDSLTNTQEAGGGSPADLTKKSGSARQPPPARGPALLARTAPARWSAAAQPGVSPTPGDWDLERRR